MLMSATALPGLAWPGLPPALPIVLLKGNCDLAGEFSKLSYQVCFHSQSHLLHIQQSCLAWPSFSYSLCMCQWVLQPASTQPNPSPSSHKHQVGFWQMSYVVQLGSFHYHPNLLYKPEGSAVPQKQALKFPA